MPKTTVSYYVPKVGFQLNITNIRNLDEIWSPQYVVQNIPWEVMIKKHDFEGEPRLAAYLYCAQEDSPPNWSTVAFATFTLLPFDRSKPPYVYRCEPFIFDENGEGYGRHKLIKWNELLDANNCYVKGGAITLNVEIEAADPENIRKCALISQEIGTFFDEDYAVTYSMTVTNIESLLAVKAPAILMKNIPCNLTVYKNRMNMLSIRVEKDKGLPSKMKVLITLISSKGAAMYYEKFKEKSFEGMTILEVKLLSWDQLFHPDNGYVTNNTITMKIEMKTSIAEHPGIKTEPEQDDQSMQMEPDH